MSGVRLRAVTAMLAVSAAGCASVSVDEAFEPVQTTVSERTGQEVQWGGTLHPESEIDAVIEELLRDGLSEDEAVRIALLNNRGLRAVYGELGIAQADLVQAGLLENPVFSATLQWTPSNERLWTLGIVEDFMSIFTIPLRKRLAETSLERTQYEVAGQVVDLIAETRHACVQLQSDLKRLDLWRTAYEATDASAEMARRLREKGNITALNAQREQALHERVKLRLAASEGAVVMDRERLNRLMGLWNERTAWTFAEALPEVPMEPFDMSDIERRAVKTSLDLRTAYLGVEGAAQQAGLSKVLSILPVLELGGEFEQAEGGSLALVRDPDTNELELEEREGSRVWEIGPTAAFPLPIFDQGQARRAAARVRLQQAWDAYTATAIDLRSQARALRERLTLARQTAVYQRDVVLPLQHRITQQTQLRYNGMLVGVFELLATRREELQAGQDYLDALQAYWAARIDMDRLLAGRMVSGGGMNSMNVTAAPGGGGGMEGH